MQERFPWRWSKLWGHQGVQRTMGKILRYFAWNTSIEMSWAHLWVDRPKSLNKNFIFMIIPRQEDGVVGQVRMIIQGVVRFLNTAFFLYDISKLAGIAKHWNFFDSCYFNNCAIRTCFQIILAKNTATTRQQKKLVFGLSVEGKKNDRKKYMKRRCGSLSLHPALKHTLPLSSSRVRRRKGGFGWIA